jgi:hypothetical protein
MGMPRKKKSETRKLTDKEALLMRVRERYKVMSEADDENRKLAMEDIKFVNVPGAQWDANMLKERGDRPAFEFNKLRINGKRLINEIRANRPQIKVRAVEGGDKEGAQLREGLFRNIANMSDLDSITDQQAEYQVDGGYGCIRVDREYAEESAFDQDILIRGVKNPFCVYSDPACKDILLRRDADDWIVTEKITRKAFEQKYGDAEVVDFEGTGVEFDDDDQWEDDEMVRVAEYWYKEPYTKEVWLVRTPTGTLAVDSSTDEAPGVQEKIASGEYQLVRKRSVECQRIMMCVSSGNAILDGPEPQPGSQFPFVPIYGEIKVVDGRVRWWGLHRFSKDAQRIYNLNRTSSAEAAHQAIKSQWWVTAKQAAGLSAQWKEAQSKNYPFMVYNADAESPGPPQRMMGPELPVAFMNLAEVDAADIRDTSGLHEASFGEESDEKSGIALARKQNQAQVVTYNFPDNMAKAIKRVGEIVLDYLPHVYDAERELRIIGSDGAEDYKRVNEVVFDPASGKTVRVNDLSSGRYDFAVTTGPSYSTQRQEAAEVYGQFVQKFPQMMGVAGDLVFKSMDLPYADDVAKRLQTLLPPQIQQQLTEGKELPPEVHAAMAQVQQAMQMVQQQTQLVQQAAQEVEASKAESDKKKAEVQKLIADLEKKRAEFERDIAKVMADLQVREANLQVKDAQSAGKEAELTFREDRVKQTESGVGEIDSIKQALSEIDSLLAQYIEAAGSTIADIKGEVSKARPKLKSISTKREDGALIAEAMMDDGSVRRLRAERKNGALTAVPIEDAAPASIQ